MKKLLFLGAVLSLVLAPGVFAQPRFQQVIEVQVKPGHEDSYEGYLKKIVDAADKIGSPVSWSTFSVAVGKSGSTYRLALGFDEWAERDKWQGGRGTLVRAFGEQEGAKISRAGRAGVASSTSRIWELLEHGTSNPSSSSQPAKFYDVQIRYVRADMIAEYRGLQRRWKAEYEAASQKPSVARWVLRMGEGTGTTFRRTQAFDSWGERDSWNPGRMINEHFGDDAPLLNERRRRAIRKTVHFVSAYRPDLSRRASGSTSNE